MAGEQGVIDIYQGEIDFEYLFSDNCFYYRVLGVQRTANHNEIRSAYRRLLLIHHPDHGGDRIKFHLIHTAKTVLLNPELRAIYD